MCDISQDNPHVTMDVLNRINTDVVALGIPPTKSVRAERMCPSPTSIVFTRERACAIDAGVTPQRERELHRKIQRMWRRDYQQ